MKDLKMGTAAGTIFSMVLMVNWQSILDTAILAAVGASVSFGVSMLWKSCCKNTGK
jgi:hypothetical protein